MAATETVSQSSNLHNSPVPRHGVVVLRGFHIQIRVDRGHLLLDDTIGGDRRHFRLPRVGHGLKRLVIVGSDGFISLSALRWMGDQGISFSMLERDGRILVTTGPVRPSDARLRRAQALAHSSGAALRIAQELIRQKLAGQEQVARHKLQDSATADTIAQFGAELPAAESITTIRLIESQAALAYWSAWRTLPINFPKNDLRRVPDHWRSFGTRISPLTASPRRATNPPNSVLNFLHAVLEAEARLAAAALGLDPGLGVLHVDSPGRDSLVLDILEPIRPQVDAYVLDWITSQPLKREWFFEQRDGNCRLMGSFASQLSETAQTWARALGPVAEWVARALWSTTSKVAGRHALATPLTQRHRREAKGGEYISIATPAPNRQRICHTCGVLLKRGQRHCASCARDEARKRMVEISHLGQVITHTPKAEALRAATQRRQRAALKAWQSSEHPSWLTEEVYHKQIQPALRSIAVSVIASALNVSLPYATQIRAGRRRPHPRHWEVLAKLKASRVSEPKS